MQLCQGRVGLGVRQRSFTRLWSGPGSGCPGQWAQSQAAGIQGSFEQHFQTQGLILGWSYVELELDSMTAVDPIQLRLFYDYTLTPCYPMAEEGSKPFWHSPVVFRKMLLVNYITFCENWQRSKCLDRDVKKRFLCIACAYNIIITFFSST